MKILKEIQKLKMIDIVNDLIKTRLYDKLEFLEKKDREIEIIISEIKKRYPKLPTNMKRRRGSAEELKIYDGRIKLILMKRSINKLEISTQNSIEKELDLDKVMGGLDIESIRKGYISKDIAERKTFIDIKIKEAKQFIKSYRLDERVYDKVFNSNDNFVWKFNPIDLQVAMSLKGSLDYLFKVQKEVRYTKKKKNDFRLLWLGEEKQLDILFDNLINEEMIALINRDSFKRHFKFDADEKLVHTDSLTKIVWIANITLLSNLIGRLFYQPSGNPLLDDTEVWNYTVNNFSKTHYRPITKNYLTSRWSMQKSKGKNNKWGLWPDDANVTNYIIENTYAKK